MKIKKLKEIIANIPDEAVVYVESDHRQQSEVAYDVFLCNDNSEYERLPHYGDDLNWFEKWEVEKEEVVAVLITAW